MYHDRTDRTQRRRRRMAAAAAIVALVLALGCAVGWGAARQQALEQGSASVRDAVLAAAAQCCAVEGSYPSTIEYLEEHYGLSINHRDYAVTYEAFASNVTPSVVVVPR